VYELVDLSFQVVRFEVPVVNVIESVSAPSSHSTQPLTDVGVNGGIYVRFTLFTLESVLLHMFCDALRVRVVPLNVMFWFM
jgi:hypothetical protein